MNIKRNVIIIVSALDNHEYDHTQGKRARLQITITAATITNGLVDILTQ